MNRRLGLWVATLLFSASFLLAAGKPVYLRAYDGEIVEESTQMGASGGIELLKPTEGAVVPLLSEGQKAYVQMPRKERVAFFANAEKRKEMRDLGFYPLTVKFAWQGEGEGYWLAISEEASMSDPLFIRASNSSLELGNFKVATTYFWRVINPATKASSKIASFSTEPDTPRLMRIDGVPNVRDMGGYVGRDGRKVKQGMVYRTAGLNNNAGFKQEPIDLDLPENAGIKQDKEAMEAMVAHLKKCVKNYKGHAMPCTVGPNWTAFVPGAECMKDEVYREYLKLTSIPSAFNNAPAQSVKADAKGCVQFKLDKHDPQRHVAFLMQEFEAPEDGVMQLGCGGDWFWAVAVNGMTLCNLLYDGNAFQTMAKDDYHLAMPVSKGKNLIAVVLVNGTHSWRWACGDCNTKEATVPLLQATYRAERTRVQNRCKRTVGRVVGANRLNDEMKVYMTKRLGIKSDIDLRSDRECYGMTGSPMGEEATWFHFSSSAYAGMAADNGKQAFTNVFRVFLDKANYPIDFHCIAGQDRTGAVAFITNGLLGVPEEKLYLDWEVTGFWNPSEKFNHALRFDKLVKVFADLPGNTLNDKIENYVLGLGFTPAEIDSFREIMLEK